VADYEDYELLNTIPGVSFITVATISCYTKDLDRFEGDYNKTWTSRAKNIFCSNVYGLVEKYKENRRVETFG